PAPPPARRQVVANFWSVQPELAEVDDVEVGLVTDRDASPVQKPDGLRGLAAQHANRSRQVDLTLGAGVSNPVGQEVGRIAGVTDHSVVRAAVAEPKHGEIAAQQIQSRALEP